MLTVISDVMGQSSWEPRPVSLCHAVNARTLNKSLRFHLTYRLLYQTLHDKPIRFKDVQKKRKISIEKLHSEIPLSIYRKTGSYKT